jgi:hypothetical protein
MTRTDWAWLTFGAICATAGALMMLGSGAGWWRL